MDNEQLQKPVVTRQRSRSWARARNCIGLGRRSRSPTKSKAVADKIGPETLSESLVQKCPESEAPGGAGLQLLPPTTPRPDGIHLEAYVQQFERPASPRSDGKQLEAPLLQKTEPPKAIEENDLESQSLIKTMTPTTKTRSLSVALAFLRLCCLIAILLGAAAIRASAFSVFKAMDVVSASVSIGAGTRIDYALRLSIDPSYCVGSSSMQDGTKVSLERCDAAASHRQQFLLDSDSTLRLKSMPNLCLTAPAVFHAGGLLMAQCNVASRQVWEFHDGGRLALKAEPGQCMNVLGMDGLDAGSDNFAEAALGLYACDGAPMNEAFVYGAGNVAIADLEDSLSGIHNSAGSIGLVDGATGWAAEMQADRSNDGTISHWIGATLTTLQQSFGLNPQQFFHRAIFSSCALICVATLLLLAVQCRKQSQLCAGFSHLASAVLIIVVLASLCRGLFSTARAVRGIQAEAKVTIPQLDHRLRISAFPEFCLTPDAAVTPIPVTMQRCDLANGKQEFIMMIDGTVRSKESRDLCLSRPSPGEMSGNILVLDTCGTGRFQTFVTRPGSASLMLKDTSPPVCVNLLGGEISTGTVGFFECRNDPNEVFAYSGGNAVLAALQADFNKIETIVNAESHKVPLQMVRASGILLGFGVVLPALWMSLACGRRAKKDTMP